MSEVSVQGDRALEELVGQVADEFLRRQAAGERPRVEDYTARHPEAADVLRKILASLQLFDASEPGALATGDDLAGTLGDFRLIREVGRGGMGIVYEAEQLSLGRRVALKVLPFAATMDARHLQRFHNEARAAAGLHHTNIVPVYAVGSERGVHFYAMQFIDGHSLATLLERQHQGPAGADQPTTARAAVPQGLRAETVANAAARTAPVPRDAEYFRRVAEWGIQAAEALDHAHEMGIVHRDVKPANLLIDADGRLWVTDFGLAQVQNDARLTMTGDLVGTLRYMSPEQALAKRAVLDHRTDVYSLGATLYEVLVQQPAFGGNDRQELLRQIAFEEPPPPRRIDRDIPAELEIMVLKALEKNPADRYGTARELADDLRRWLDGRPIQGRRPSLAQRLRKWARRHRAVVTTAAACLVVVLAVVAGSVGWVARDRAERRDEAARRAGEALAQAEGFLEQENWPEGERAVEQAEGFLTGYEEETALRLQAQQLRRELVMASQLDEARVEKTATRDGQFDYAAADAQYERAFREYGLDIDEPTPPAVEQIRARPIHCQLVAALDDWARMRKALKRTGWRERLALARVADPDPWRNRLRDAVESKDLKILEELATAGQAEEWPLPTLVLLGELANGTPARERVADLLVRAQQRHPNDFWINEILGLLLMDSRPRLEEAIRFHSIAVALRPGSPGAHVNLGVALRDNGRLDQASAEFREAIHLKNDYATAHNNLGAALSQQGRQDEAIGELREAIRLKKDDVEAHYNLATALAAKGRLDEAIAENHVAMQFRPDDPWPYWNLGLLLKGHKDHLDEAIAAFRKVTELKPDFADAHQQLGFALSRAGRLDDALPEFRQAIHLKKDFADAYYNLGTTLHRRGRPDEADEAIGAYRKAISLKPELARAHCNLAMLLERKGQFSEALEEFRRGDRLGRRDPHWPYPSTEWVRKCERRVQLDARLAAVLSGQKQPADADERLALARLCAKPFKKRYADAVRFCREAFAQEPKRAEDLKANNRYNAACLAALAGCGHGQTARPLTDPERAGLRQQALDWLRADLAAWQGLLEEKPAKLGPAVQQKMQQWQQDPDFADVRGPAALARLPQAERTEWQKLWQEVEALRQRAVTPK